VIVALELPVDEQDALDAFIAAADEADARKQLLAARHWRWEAQDGRGSQAMFDLLARVRELRAAGATIAVRAFDLVDPKDELREQKMAANIQLMREEDPHATLLALTGNLHGSTVKGTP
jgi:hypothetical protein